MASIAMLNVRGRNMFADGINLGMTLAKAKLPINQDSYESFSPAVANGSIEIAVSADAIELSFETVGIQPQLLAQCNSAFGQRRKYTYFGALVDEMADNPANRLQQVEATVIGRLNAELNEDDPKAIGGTQYTVKSILKYTLRIGGLEICRFDLKLGGWLDAEGQRLEIAQMIGLSS